MNAWTVIGPMLFGALLHANAADEPPAAEFEWRATVDTSGQSGLVRLPLPGEALARIQSRALADLRVIDAQGRPVPFALAAPPRPAVTARPESGTFRALPLYAAQPGVRPPQGVVQLQVDESGQRQSLWVQLGDKAGSAPEPQARRLPAALFDTRAQKEAVTGFVVRAHVPANVPVRFTLATSQDLASWTPVPVQGRVYRFEGDGAPANDRLELTAPLQLRNRYLRIDWGGQQGVVVDAVVGLLAAPEAARDYPAVSLGAAYVDGTTALEWQLPFATPIARLELATSQANTLLPLRVLGRTQRSDPWRGLGQTLVYRLGVAGQESTNSAMVLPQPAIRWLRLEATHGARIDGVPLAARALFEPQDVVFVAAGTGPYRVLAGRSDTKAIALPLSMLAAASGRPVEALPIAQVVSVETASAPPARWWNRWLPRGVEGRTAALWLVLAAGVLVLGGVAWSLLRQVHAKSPGT